MDSVNIYINECPGEKISDLTNIDLSYIKVMRGAHDLPQRLDTTLPLKVCQTSRDISNHNIFNYYANTNETENKYYIKHLIPMGNDNA